MSVIKSFFSAISMYSRLPVPQVEWKEENHRWSLCFFPIIGAFIGALLLLWYKISVTFSVNTLLFSAVCTVIPIVITGGIHLDGFCDVCDAKASHSEREKQLEIMSDSHIGAFAAIGLAVYLLLQTALFSEIIGIDTMLVCAFAFVQSRAFSALAAVTFKSAKKDGTLAAFSKPAYRLATVFVQLIVLAVSACTMLYVNPLCGMAALCGGLIAFAYYRVFSYKKYGGITGDLAGYFLQICEIAEIFAVIAAEKIIGVIVL